MGSTRFACIGALAGVVMFATIAGAQTSSFRDLPSGIKVNQTIEIETDNGGLVTGKVAEITPTSITVLRRPAPAVDGTRPNQLERLTVSEQGVRRIRRMDSLWNGAVIGFVAGAIPASYIFQFGCGEDGSCGSAGAMGLLIGGGVGLAVGAGVDGLLHKTLYEAAAAPNSIAFAPMIGGGRRGVSLTVKF
jgi:hypothetical protein